MASVPLVREVLEQRLLQKVRAADPQLAGAARAQLFELAVADLPLCLRGAFVRALLEVDPRAPERIGLELAGGSPERRERWLAAMAESAHPAARGLLQAYAEDHSTEVRALCAIGLGRCGESGSAALLAKRLALESSARVLRHLAEACGRIADPVTAPQLRALLRSPATAVRTAAAAALGRIKDTEARLLLTELLRSGDSAQRYAAAESLGEMGSEAAVPALAAGLQDSNPTVRRRAAYALGLIGGPSTVEPLAQALQDLNPGVRSRAAYALGSAADSAALPPLRDALADPVLVVRRQVADALSRLEASGSAGILVALLEQPEPEIWQRAAWGLGQRGDRRALEPLRRMLRDPEDRIRARAVQGLEGLDAQADLRSALLDQAAAVRLRAWQALARRGLTRAELLEALSDPDPSVVEAACALLLDPARA